MANRIWHHHFGRGIVGTPERIGIMGDAVTSLDWLGGICAADGA
jgi:hypothetical protein